MQRLLPGPISDLIFMEWLGAADGYLIEERAAYPMRDGGSPPAGPYLTPIGSASFAYRPMEDYPALFQEFANVEMTPDGVVEFANKYGTPAGDRNVIALREFGLRDRKLVEGFDPEAVRRRIRTMHEGNRLGVIYAQIQDMRNAVERYERRDMDAIAHAWPIASTRLQLDFVPGRDAPSLFFEPETLNEAMWIQYAHWVTGHMKIQKCVQCPAWFAHGVGTGRRKSAIYCSDRCRKAAHEKRRRASR